MKQRWLLPAGIEEALPDQALWLENARRSTLDLFSSWGYELVMPPFIEYLESLMTEESSDLDLQTFKLTDQLNGRLMGVRADMTPQVARIDAHRIKKDTPTRLCYMGTVLKTRPTDLSGNRSPLQIGAELYGHLGLNSDLEIIHLMFEMLKSLEINNLTLSLNNVSIFNGLLKTCDLSALESQKLTDIFKRKSQQDLDQFSSQVALPENVKACIQSLNDWHGTADEVAKIKPLLAAVDNTFATHLDELLILADSLGSLHPELNVNFDLADLSGFHYETGIIFAVYAPGTGQAITRGGRYDGIGKIFGRTRPATGFSADLKQLSLLSNLEFSTDRQRIFAPLVDDQSLQSKISTLRTENNVVIQGLTESDTPDLYACKQALVQHHDQWIVKAID